jgi:putative ABC transport system permease protein
MPETAIGQTIVSLPPWGGWNQPGELEIVGVVQDFRATSRDSVQPMIYQPLSGRVVPQVLIGRTSPTPVAALVERIEPGIRVRVTPLSETLDGRLRASRVGAGMAGALGALALTLASIGIFGVFAYWVQQRTQEIGIRMALGVRAAQVVRLVLGSSARAVSIGLAIGFAASVVSARVLRSFLHGLSPLDPVAYGAVVLVLAVAGLSATYIPARRATRIDPLTALRYE